MREKKKEEGTYRRRPDISGTRIKERRSRDEFNASILGMRRIVQHGQRKEAKYLAASVSTAAAAAATVVVSVAAAAIEMAKNGS